MGKKYSAKVALLTFGNMIAAIGVSFCALAGKGADPLTVMFQGICNLTGLEIGVVAFGVNVVMLIICLIADRKSIKSGTILSMCTFSVFLNFFINYIGQMGLDSTMPFTWLYLILGIVLMGTGFSTCIFAGIGPNCIDVVLELLMTKTKFSMKMCKMAVDFTSAIIGILLGAKFGIGTVLCVMLVGVIYTFNMQMLSKMQRKSKTATTTVIAEELRA